MRLSHQAARTVYKISSPLSTHQSLQWVHFLPERLRNGSSVVTTYVHVHT